MTSEMPATSLHTQGVWVVNPHTESIVLCLEPWGDEIELPGNSSFLVMFDGPSGNFPEVEWEEGRVTVCGWSGSLVSVYHHGKVLRSCGSLRVPEGWETIRKLVFPRHISPGQRRSTDGL